MLGFSVVDPIFLKISRISIFRDLEDIIADLPWYVGMFFWFVPILFSTFLCAVSLFSIFIAGFWVAGIVGFLFGKFFGSGWFRYGHGLLKSSLTGMLWYDKLHEVLSKSKKRNLNADRATGLSKSFANVYNRFNNLVAS